MPVTPLHLIPALALYFPFSRRIHSLAFFAATLLIDVEPTLYLVFHIPIPQIPLLFFDGDTPVGLHTITHNPFGIVLIVAPAMTILSKILEETKRFGLTILKNSRGINYPARTIYLSALLGASLHLSWDLTMHLDINLAFPFYYISNPFVNLYVLDMFWNISLITLPLSLILSLKINHGHPFKKIP